jgi:hypothetical protein
MIVLAPLLMCALGIAVVLMLWKAPPRFSPAAVLAVSLGIGAGIGLSSCVYFLLLSAGAGRWTVVAMETALVAAAAAGAWYLKAFDFPAEDRADNPGIVIIGPFLLTFAIAAGALAVSFGINREGVWDAWAIWNLHARYLFRGGPEFWRNTFNFTNQWAHPDYPLMLPAAVALCWTIAGVESALGPQFIAILFGLATVGVLTSAVAILRGRTQALLAGTLLLGTAYFVQMTASEYADVPLAFYVLATLVLFALQDRSPADLRFTALAGAMAAFAAWTKNEGLLFLAVSLIGRALALFRYRGTREMLRQMPAAVAGALPVLVVVALFKLRYAPANDVMARVSAAQSARNAIDPSRYLLTLESLGVQLFHLGQFLIPILLVLAVYAWLVGFKVEEPRRLPVATAIATLGLMLLGDLAVYIFLSPFELHFQLDNSLDRLLLQLWPAAILTFFTMLAAPVLSAPAVSKKAAPKPSPKPVPAHQRKSKR